MQKVQAVSTKVAVLLPSFCFGISNTELIFCQTRCAQNYADQKLAGMFIFRFKKHTFIRPKSFIICRILWGVWGCLSCLICVKLTSVKSNSNSHSHSALSFTREMNVLSNGAVTNEYPLHCKLYLSKFSS